MNHEDDELHEHEGQKVKDENKALKKAVKEITGLLLKIELHAKHTDVRVNARKAIEIIKSV